MGKEELLNKIKATKDKELYYSSPIEYLSDFDFIIGIIEIFKDDFDFIDEIVRRYIKSMPLIDFEDKDYLELIILLGKYVPQEHINYEYYTLRLVGIYKLFLMGSFAKQERSGKEDDFDYGFSNLVKKYGDRKNILDFFASKMIESVYSFNSLGSLEELVHKNYDDFGEIIEEGYGDFFIRNLTEVDYELGTYVLNNPELLDDVCEQLDNVGHNWDHYEEDYEDFIRTLFELWLKVRKDALVYGENFDYEQAFGEVIVSQKMEKLFNIDRNRVLNNRSSVISFEFFRFKKDLIAFINQVFPYGERLTMAEMATINIQLPDEQKRLLKEV